MQLSTVFAVLAASVIAVAAGEYPPPWPKPSSSYYKRDLTNGERMARNLPLRPPTRYWGATPTYGTLDILSGILCIIHQLSVR